jgi:replication factor A1
MTSEIENKSKTTEEKQETKIKDLEPRMNNLVATFKVVDIGETREVSSRHSYETHRVADATVGDETGIVLVPLWNESIEEMVVGKTYRLEDGFTGLFRGSLQLKIGRNSKVTETDDEIETVNNEVNMSAESHQTSRDRGYYQPRRRSRSYGGYGSYRRRDFDRYSRHDGTGRRRW